MGEQSGAGGDDVRSKGERVGSREGEIVFMVAFCDCSIGEKPWLDGSLGICRNPRVGFFQA